MVDIYPSAVMWHHSTCLILAHLVYQFIEVLVYWHCTCHYSLTNGLPFRKRMITLVNWCLCCYLWYHTFYIFGSKVTKSFWDLSLFATLTLLSFYRPSASAATAAFVISSVVERSSSARLLPEWRKKTMKVVLTSVLFHGYKISSWLRLRQHGL